MLCLQREREVRISLAEIYKVKKMMGHASLSSTQVYTNADIEQLKNIFNKTHPRGNVKTQLSSDDEKI